jgi:hypothetical protein
MYFIQGDDIIVAIVRYTDQKEGKERFLRKSSLQESADM